MSFNHEGHSTQSLWEILKWNSMAARYLPRLREPWHRLRILHARRRLHYFPASQSNISFLWRVHFSAHESICPIRLVKLRRTVDFQRPKRQYPERPKPVSTVYFQQSSGLEWTVLGVRELCNCCWFIIIQPVFWSYSLDNWHFHK